MKKSRNLPPAVHNSCADDRELPLERSVFIGFAEDPGKGTAGCLIDITYDPASRKVTAVHWRTAELVVKRDGAYTYPEGLYSSSQALVWSEFSHFQALNLSREQLRELEDLPPRDYF